VIYINTLLQKAKDLKQVIIRENPQFAWRWSKYIDAIKISIC